MENANENNGLPPFCQTNPLIPAGVFPASWAELYAAVARLPTPPSWTARNKDSFTRLLYLAELENFYFPAIRDIRSAMTIVRMLLKGLGDRKPNAAYWRAHNSTCNTLAGDASIPAVPRFSGAAATTAIIGVSGGGKTTFVENLLSTIPQMREHDQRTNPLLPRHQILWLKVICPVNRNPRAFITEFFTIIDSLVGSNYGEAYKNENDDELIVRMAKVARAHFLGILIIDEIQNAAGRRVTTDRRLMKLFVRISATLGVPIVFIGTPKSQEILNAELADARRMIGPHWLPYTDDDKEWHTYLDALCKIQYTKTETFLDPAPESGPSTSGGLRAKFYELTQGIPALAKALWGLAQEKVIMEGKKEQSELITTEVLQDTFDKNMQSVAAAVAALRTKSGLNIYDDLLPKDLPKPNAWEKNSAAMEQLALDCYQDALARAARKKAREQAEDMFEGETKP